MSELLLLAQPARSMPLPLLLRSAGHQQTIHQAAGFGALLSPATLEKVQADMFAAYAALQSQDQAQHRSADTPVALRQPDMARVRDAVGAEAKRLSPEATLTLLLGKLQKTLGDGSLETLRQRMDVNRAQFHARGLRAESVIAAQQAALDAVAAAEALVDAAAAEAGTQQGAVEAAREEVERLRAELEGMDPEDPDHANKQAQLAAAQGRLQTSEKALGDAAGKLLEAGAVLDRALGELEQVQEQADALNKGQPLGVDVPRDRLSASAKLQELIAKLSLIMSDFSLDKLKKESEVLIEQLKAREAENLEKARKYEEEQQRARDAEKKTGCAGKIFKWIGAAVGVMASVGAIVAGAMHGNVALVAAGVMGLMLSVDAIAGMTTGFSVVGKTIEGLGTVITDVLIEFGVPEDAARQAGMIIATIVVIVAIVAVMLATGNIAAGARQAASAANIAKTAMETTRTLADRVQQGAQIMQVIGQASGIAGQITQGVGEVIVAGIMLDASKLLAAMEEGLQANQVLQDMLSSLREAVAMADRTALDLLVQMNDVNQNSVATGQAVIAHMRGRA